MKYKLLIAVMGTLIFNIGCATKEPKTEPRFEQTIYPKTDCYQRYQIAITECDSFLKGQSNPHIKDKQTIKCLSNKGFPKGMDSCL